MRKMPHATIRRQGLFRMFEINLMYKKITDSPGNPTGQTKHQVLRLVQWL
jgi:hypothetical protein